MYCAQLIVFVTALVSACGETELPTVPAAITQSAAVTESRPNAVSNEPRCRDCGRQSWRGFFNDLKQGATFTDCRDGIAYPVLDEGDYPSLEMAYLRARSAPGAALMVRLQGSLVQRSVAPTRPPQAHLLVQLFQNTLPGHDCDGPRTPNPDEKKGDRAIAHWSPVKDPASTS